MLWHPAWRLTRYASTACHEAGHALVALLARRQLRGIRLERDSSGLTISRGRPTGPGAVLTLAAGYPAPSAAGLLAAWGCAAHRPGLVLLGALLGAVALLLWVRNVFGWLVVVVLGAAAWLVLDRAPAAAGAAALGVAVFLLVAGVQDVVDLWRHDVTGRSDPAQLGRITWLPRGLWKLLFLLWSVTALALGLWLLRGDLVPGLAG